MRESCEVKCLISQCSESSCNVCRTAVSLKDLGGREGGVGTVVLLKKKAHSLLTLPALSGSHYRVDSCTLSLPPHDLLPSLLPPSLRLDIACERKGKGYIERGRKEKKEVRTRN